MTPTIAELRRLHEAATPGPWRVADQGTPHRGQIRIEENSERGFEVIATTYCGAFDGHGAGNASFIAAARNALPSLLDRAEMLEEAVRLLRAIHAAFPLDGGVANFLARVTALDAGEGVTRG